MTWFEIEEKHMMEAYIQRHKDEKVMDTLEDIKKNAKYSCSDPRLQLGLSSSKFKKSFLHVLELG